MRSFRAATPWTVLALSILAVFAQSAAARAPGCGSTVSHSIKLHADITGCSGSGFIVGASGITINLNGHTISAADPSTNAGNGIQLIGKSKVTVENGTIAGFQTGVASALTTGDSIHDLKFDADVRGLTMDGNSNTAARLTGNNESVGVIISGKHNTVSSSTMNNGVPGAGLGFFITGGDRNVLKSDTAKFNLSEGFTLVDLMGDPAVGNRIIGARSVGNGHYGISIAPETSKTLVKGSVANQNGDGAGEGIHVESPSTTLTANRAFFNVDLGIEGVKGVTDGGKNKASGNGDPRQCTFVDCG